MLAIQASGLPVNQAGDPVTVSKWCKNTTQPDFTETGKDFGIAKD